MITPIILTWRIVCVFSCTYLLSHVRLFVTPWIVARQAPLSMGTLQARILGSSLPCPPPGDLPNPGTEPRSPAQTQVSHIAGRFFTINNGKWQSREVQEKIFYGIYKFSLSSSWVWGNWGNLGLRDILEATGYISGVQESSGLDVV